MKFLQSVSCNLEPEDREHFILKCPILETKRKFYLHQIFEILREHSKEQLLNTVREEQEQFILNALWTVLILYSI